MCVEEEDEDSMASVSSTKANILLIEGSGTEEEDMYLPPSCRWACGKGGHQSACLQGFNSLQGQLSGQSHL